MSVPPKIRPFSFDEEIFAGEAAELQCSAYGDTPMVLQWTFQTFQGTALNPMKGVHITKTSQKSSLLRIESLQAENSGIYTVIGLNFVDGIKLKFLKK